MVAASIDPREKAAETVEKLSLTFPVGYGLPVAKTVTLPRPTTSVAGSVADTFAVPAAAAL